VGAVGEVHLRTSQGILGGALMRECPHCNFVAPDGYALRIHQGWHTTKECEVCSSIFTKYERLLELRKISPEEVTNKTFKGGKPIRICSNECRLARSNELTKEWRKANPEQNRLSQQKSNEKKSGCPKRKAWQYEYARRPEVMKRNREKLNQYYSQNYNGKRDKHKAYSKRPEVIKKRKERAKKYRKQRRVEKPTLSKSCVGCNNTFQTKNVRKQYCTEKCRLDTWKNLPENKVSSRIRGGIRKVLIGKAKDSRTFDYLNYNKYELASHIESQFVEGMSWDNISEWHIDHIRPVSSFTFKSMDDPEFKACWALDNLQPLWAFDNLSKGAKWEGLTDAEA